MIKDYIKLVLDSVLHRKLRSWLTIIGIVIGIAAIISLITLGTGLENAINYEINKLGPNSIRVVPKGFRGPGTGGDVLTKDDVKTIEDIRGIDYVEPNLIERGKLEYNKEEFYINIRGFPSNLVEKNIEDLGFSFDSGTGYREGEKSKAIIGYNLAYNLFKKKVNIRNSIYINGKKFKVVGILNEMGLQNMDNSVHIPIDVMREIFDEPEKVSFIRIQVINQDYMDSVAERVTKQLKKKRNDEAFEVYTPEQLMEQVKSILGIIQIVLGAIAAISLLVGGIGVMNSMFTSVRERTNQIGTMKAIGATNGNIITLFMLESGIMGLMGGFLGVILGKGLAYAVEIIVKQLGFMFLVITIDWKLILFVMIFSFIIGIISGTLPALKAAKLKPVEALRYE